MWCKILTFLLSQAAAVAAVALALLQAAAALVDIGHLLEHRVPTLRLYRSWHSLKQQTTR
jgi:hypothetical protein